MLSYKLLKDIEEYIRDHFTEELPASAVGESAVAFWNEHTEDKHNLEVPEFLDEEVQANNLMLDDSIVKESHYNPNNDFPIPSFLKTEILSETAKDEDALELGKPQKDNLPTIKAKKLKASQMVRAFNANKSIDFSEDDIFNDTVFEEALPTFASSCFDKSESIDRLKAKISLIDESFGEMLVKMIDALGMTDADCYKKAQLNRSHFNRIKNDPEYHIQKETVFALALALSLNKNEADGLLKKAGYAFSPNSKLDLIVEYCISNGIYDVVEVNQLLYAFDQKLLGAGIRE